MSENSNRFKIILLSQLFCLIVAHGWSQDLNFKVAGDSIQGYSVDIYDGSNLLIQNTEEFSIEVANLDLSETSNIAAWKGSTWSGSKNEIVLTRDTFLSEFDLNLSVSVTYKIINQNVIKKTIDLFQSGMPSLYYTLTQTSKPAQAPIKYVSFEHDNFPGGFSHEIFPSIGFVTPNNQLVGFLMDAGYKNHYTRSTRRRFNGHGGGFVGMRRLPDPALVSVANNAERGRNQHYIRQTFGQMYNLDSGTDLKLELPENFKKLVQL